MLRRIPGLSRSSRRVRNFLRIAGSETLEVRILPTVTASLSRGVLTLTGDAAANDVSVEQDTNGVRIVGRNGTLIRFAGADAASFVFSGVTSLKGTFGAAADHLQIDDGVTLKDLTLSLGDGANHVELDGAALTGKFSMTTGAGDDVFELRASATNVLTVNTGEGNDHVEFRAAVMSGSSSIVTGAGLDSVETSLGPGGVANVFQDLSINTGNDDDSVELRNATVRKLNVSTGSGADDIAMESVAIHGTLSIDTGIGDDELTLDGVQQTGSGANVLTTGAGVDQVRLKTSLFTAATSTSLGAGTGNVLEIDDCGFQSTAQLATAGVGDRIEIEQDNSRAGLTDFHGTVKAMVGAASEMWIGLNQDASYTRFFGSVTLKGGRPSALVKAALLRIEFASQPNLVNADLETV